MCSDPTRIFFYEMLTLKLFSDDLLSILWNVHNYYSQFAAVVSAHVKEKRAPIEKKLRDFVKICTWDRDLSYWSVKDTVEKAHKALHKHTKEFEVGIQCFICSLYALPLFSHHSDHFAKNLLGG